MRILKWLNESLVRIWLVGTKHFQRAQTPVQLSQRSVTGILGIGIVVWDRASEWPIRGRGLRFCRRSSL